jgi:hypothetical protein
MGEILVDGGQFVIIHFSDRTPRHLFADLMTVGIDASTHGCGEAGQRPVLDQIQVGSERWQLPGHATGQLLAVARTAVLIRILAKLKGRPFAWCRNMLGDDWVAAWQDARASNAAIAINATSSTMFCMLPLSK